MSASETAHLLGELIEATSQEREQVAKLLSQYGTVMFWERLEDWGLPTELLEKLQAVKQILQAMDEGRDT
ncbi:hypothetical protein D3C74_182340 [compost metagenome]